MMSPRGRSSSPPQDVSKTQATSTSKSAQTPFMKQWFAAKERYPDALIFFRMGDFYELFFDDAIKASQILGLTLTSRNKNEPDEIPMAGAPYHSSHTYISRALNHGLKIAVCEQMADPSKVKGIVPREVVRVITPGIVVDETALDARTNHWIVAIEDPAESNPSNALNSLGFAALDYSTGELMACLIEHAPVALAEAARFQAHEILLSPSAHHLHDALAAILPRTLIQHEDFECSQDEIQKHIQSHFRETTFAPQLQSAPLLIRKAVMRVLLYAQRCTPGTSIRIARLIFYAPSDTLQMDEATVQHLELVRGVDRDTSTSLLAQIDSTQTSAGARLLRRWLLAPLCDVAAIRRRLDAVELFRFDAPLRDSLRAELAKVGDFERLATRISLGQASPRDLGALRDGLTSLPAIDAILRSSRQPEALEILGLDRPFDTLADVHALLDHALLASLPIVARDGGLFKEGYDSTLDELATFRKSGDAILLELENKLRIESNIANLKLRFNKVYGWYLEVTRSNLEKVPTSWKRKQTVATGERYTTNELDALQDKLLSAEDRHLEREIELFEALRNTIAKHCDRLRESATRLAHWDVFSALADVAHRFEYVRPDVDDSLQLELEESRHPVVERLLPSSGPNQFVPNDVSIAAEENKERLLIVTGPNMAGKSTLMRQVALTCIMAQMGSFVAAKKAHIGLIDRLMTRVGASDNLARGASTFMVEMRETASILQQSTRRSLIVLDEIGRGTSTYDGLAIAWAVAEHIHDVIGARTFFATHYHELCELVNTSKGAANYSVAAREMGDDIVFLHRLVKGGASRSYGIAVAKLAGVSESVLARARAILASLEDGSLLPSGTHSSLRGRSIQGNVQLDMFHPNASAQNTNKVTFKPHPALETLRQIEPDRLSPIEAWQLIVKLKVLSNEAND